MNPLGETKVEYFWLCRYSYVFEHLCMCVWVERWMPVCEHKQNFGKVNTFGSIKMQLVK